MYRDRIRDHEDSKLAARWYVGQLLDINPATLWNWVEREEIDTGERPGVPSDTEVELRRLQREVAELRRANEILKTASAYFAAAELDRRFGSS
jgi:transposase